MEYAYAFWALFGFVVGCVAGPLLIFLVVLALSYVVD